METAMEMIPVLCPICRSESIGQILRDTLLSAYIEGLACPSSGTIAYHCHAGHIFVIVGEGFRWKEPVLQVDGNSILV